MKILPVFCLLLMRPGGDVLQGGDEVAEIRKVLEDQVAAWNAGDLKGYMAGYWKSDSTVFTSGGTLVRGWDSVYARYRRAYSNREKMGSLEFGDLTVRMLGPEAAVASGAWKLHRSGGDVGGRFTLIVELKDGLWRITHDHTSSAS
ncbi:MAG TPA: SgcJ/EcaC family oxidoreductase [Bacteroidota bacterium]|nr:SgcJ/EcaC family oxidoreductase [Bacteroidota bacterium]